MSINYFLDDPQEELDNTSVKIIFSDSVLTLPSEQREEILYEAQNLSIHTNICSGEFNIAGSVLHWAFESSEDDLQILHVSLSY